MNNNLEIDIICKALFLIQNIDEKKIYININGNKNGMSDYVHNIFNIYCKNMLINFFDDKNINTIYKKNCFNFIFYKNFVADNKFLININLEKFIDKQKYNRNNQTKGVKFLYNKFLNL